MCGPYRQSVCLDDSYLLTASLYIHQNPVKAGLAADSSIYRWSSCRLYCQDTAKESFINEQFVLGLLSTDMKSAKKRYRRLLKRAEGLEPGDVLEQEEVVESYLDRLASMLPSIFDKIRSKKRIAWFSGIDFLDKGQLDELVEAVRNGRFSNKVETRKAKRYVIDQLIARGYKRKEIADRMGISRKTIYNLLRSST